jgi:hypothetical protein
MLSRILVFSTLLTLSAAHAACPDGRWLVAGQPLLPSATASDAVLLDGTRVAIASGCAPVEGRVRRVRDGFVVKARWTACGQAARVRLRARVDLACQTMQGRFAAARPQIRRDFSATPAAPCTPGEPGCWGCDDNADCGAREYCATVRGDCDGPGLCQARPELCLQVFDPVCGCDGRTYPNECVAAGAGVSVRARGRCRPSACGMFAGATCPDGEFCEFPPGTCGAADVGGECVAGPTPCPRIYRPVCGCDGVTYGNDCNRRNAQVPKLHDGSCDGSK